MALTWLGWGTAAFGFLVAVVKTLGQVKSLATRVVVWTYGLMILITIATYTGYAPSPTLQDSINVKHINIDIFTWDVKYKVWAFLLFGRNSFFLYLWLGCLTEL